MIVIRKIDGGEIFDLPEDYTIESERNNPIFESKGSQTVSINFQETKKNKKMLAFPGRLDRNDRMDDPIPVIVESGPIQQRGLLAVGAAGGGTISGNIGFDESEMYNKMSEMQLRDIPGLPFVDKGGSNLSQKTDSILAHLTAVMKEKEAADYIVFPLVVKTYSITTNSKDVQIYEILNNINTGWENTGVSLGELLALENRTIIRGENGTTISISAPKGYGVTAFLKVGKIIDLIFKQYGFRVEENPFNTHRQLKKLVVLNNTADAIMTGILYYRDMMPDITVQEFLDALYAKFGMVYFVDSNKRAVNIRFLKDILIPDQTKNRDLTSKLTAEPVISYSGQKQIRLKANRATMDDKKQSADVLFNTYEELLAPFDSKTSQAFSFNNKYSRYSVVNIFQFDPNNNDIPMIRYSSDFFDWDKKTSRVKYEDIDQKDICLPFSKYDMLLLLNYPVDFKQAYTELIISGEKQEGIVNPAPLAFAFSWGLVQAGTPMNPWYYSFASQINRDLNGNFMSDATGNKYDISLTNNQVDGLFNRFWKEYDAFIRHSNQEVTCKMHLSDIEIMSIDLHEPVFIRNQPFVIQQIKYKQNTQEKIAELILRTLRLYEADNLEEEQRIPEILGTWPYYWNISQVENTLTIDSADSATFVENRFNRKYYEVNGVQIPISAVSYLPPTEAQYLAGEVRVYRYEKLYDAIWISPPPLRVATTVTVTFRAAKTS